MVFVFEIRNEHKSCDEIFVHFKVVNENGVESVVEEIGNGVVIPSIRAESDSEGTNTEGYTSCGGGGNMNNNSNLLESTNKKGRKILKKLGRMPCKDVYKLRASCDRSDSDTSGYCSGHCTYPSPPHITPLILSQSEEDDEEEDEGVVEVEEEDSINNNTDSGLESVMELYRALINSGQTPSIILGSNSSSSSSGEEEEVGESGMEEMENNIVIPETMAMEAAADSADDTPPLCTGSSSEGESDLLSVTILPPLEQAVSHGGSMTKIQAPALLSKSPNVMDLSLYLTRIQQYFNQLGYHRQGEPKIRVLTNLSIKHQIETARSLIKAAEAIKCLHALVLAIHLTNCSNHVERFPINFKSEFNGKEYKHVVLGVYLYGLFGALGISRDPGLQDKPAAYPRLLDLILDYHRCYNESGHILKEVKIGGVVTHDPHSIEPINWKIGTVQMEQMSASQLENSLEKISKQLRSKMGPTCLRNVRPTQMVFPTPGDLQQPPSTAPSRVQAKKSKTAATIMSTTKKVTKK